MLLVRVLLFVALVISVQASVFVDYAEGKDSNSGTIESPFLTLAKAASVSTDIHVSGYGDESNPNCNVTFNSTVIITASHRNLLKCHPGSHWYTAPHTSVTFSGLVFDNVSIIISEPTKAILMNSFFDNNVTITSPAEKAIVKHCFFRAPLIVTSHASNKMKEIEFLNNTFVDISPESAITLNQINGRISDNKCLRSKTCLELHNVDIVAINFYANHSQTGVKLISGKVNLVASHFENNLRAIDAFDSRYNKYLMVKGCRFLNNHNDTGSDVYATRTDATVAGNVFENSFADTFGGSLNLHDGTFFVENNKFYNVSAGSHAAAIYHDAFSPIAIFGNHFDKCRVKHYDPTKNNNGYVVQLPSQFTTRYNIHDNTVCEPVHFNRTVYPFSLTPSHASIQC